MNVLVVIRHDRPDVVHADHTESQLADVLLWYREEEFEIWRTEESAYAPGPVPTEHEIVRALVTG